MLPFLICKIVIIEYMTISFLSLTFSKSNAFIHMNKCSMANTDVLESSHKPENVPRTCSQIRLTSFE